MDLTPVEDQKIPPVNETLRWIVAGFRFLSWVWVVMLISVIIANDGPGNREFLVLVIATVTIWAGVTMWAARTHERLSSPWFVATDTVLSLGIGAAGLLAGTEDFINGGWPNSWLFVVAYAADKRWTLAAGFLLALEHVPLHLAHGLDPVRTAGVFQFLVFALVAGWGFETLRTREALRLAAQQKLAEQEHESARYEARVELARQLHDSYLQTLVSTRAAAEDADQVRYLTRRQERELRRTIAEFRSPYTNSFKSALMKCRDEVSELYPRLDIAEVVRDDAEVTPVLEVALRAAREAMLNAAKHSGAETVDLYSEREGAHMHIHVRDRGKGFDPNSTPRRGLSLSIVDPVEKAGGSVSVQSAPGEGTEVTITVACDA